MLKLTRYLKAKNRSVHLFLSTALWNNYTDLVVQLSCILIILENFPVFKFVTWIVYPYKRLSQEHPH